MTLAAGTRLGPYEIVAAIGAGGMGEVYRARDTKLNRDVALKILPDAFASDPDRLARFTREAQTLAALNHPHIAQIYSVGEAASPERSALSPDKVQFLVMELVQGEDLSQRIARGAIPLDEALPIARQIAEALEAAHEQGIIHRDLKPANIKVRADGTVKVLDFGLAKALDPVGSAAAVGVSNLPTITSPAMMTGVGMILGTAAYMAPEQAKGRTVDKRADIWAFGAVLFEMLTGKRAFPGEDVSDTIAHVLMKEPDWATLPVNTPVAIRKLLRRCLEKDRKRRLADMADARLEIEDALTSPAEAARPLAGVSRTGALGRPVALGLMLTLSATAFIVGAVAMRAAIRLLGPQSNQTPPQVTRTLVSVAPAGQLRANNQSESAAWGMPSRTAMALSPDGRSLVFSANAGGKQQLYLRALDQLDAAPLAGTEGADSPFFSPDGKWVGFWANGALKKVALSGGPATTICQTDAIFGASWGSNDTIVFARVREGLLQVPGAGGTPQSLTTLDTAKGEVSHRLPQVLPGAKAVVFTITHDAFPKWDVADIVVQSLVTGERKTVAQGADARYASTGHLVYARAGTLMAMPFDLARLQVTGGAVSVMADVMQAANIVNVNLDTGAAQFSVSASGALVYATGGAAGDAERRLVWVDRAGLAQPLSAPPRAYFAPRLSPDGQRVVVYTRGTGSDVWTFDITRGTLTRLTTEGRNGWGLWTPDGKRVVFQSGPGVGNLFWKPADGSGAAERLTTSEYTQVPASWSPDGQTLAFVESHPVAATGSDIWALPLAGDRRPRPLLQTKFNETYPEFSPDGRWLAYVSNESGRDEVYVQPYPGPGPRQQVSVDGGEAPAWSRDGRELFYSAVANVGQGATTREWIAVPLTTAPSLRFGAPRVLFQARYQTTLTARGYDVTSDGQRFLMVSVDERPPIKVTQMILVQNWVEELKRRVPTR